MSDKEKTLKEKVERAINVIYTRENTVVGWGDVMQALMALEAELQRARDALRWIPCEERLPEKEGYYLVTFETGSVEIDYFIPGHGFDCSPSCPVIAWKERTILSAYTPEEK